MTGRGPIDWARQQQTEREQQPARKLLDQMSDAELAALYERADRAERLARSAARDTAKALADYLAAEQRAEQAEAAITRVRNLAADMRTWASPRGLANHYADSIETALDGPKEFTP